MTRRILVDENIPPLVAQTLRSAFIGHEFLSAHDNPPRYVGVDDIELFARLGQDGFGAIITQDRNQVRDSDERAALRQYNLHWIGLQAKRHGGVKGIAMSAATLMAGMPFVLTDWRDVPHLYRLKGVQAEQGQRLTISENRV